MEVKKSNYGDNLTKRQRLMISQLSGQTALAEGASGPVLKLKYIPGKKRRQLSEKTQKMLDSLIDPTDRYPPPPEVGGSK
jgi:hypothetical protein